MPRIVPDEFKRNYSAKTGVRLCEARMIAEIAEEEGVCPSDVVYAAVQKFLIERRPDECSVNKIGSSLLVGRAG